MKSVNVRQLKNNPSDALRMARKAPVVVMNRDQPEALLFHLDDEGLLGEPGVRLFPPGAPFRDATVWAGGGGVTTPHTPPSPSLSAPDTETPVPPVHAPT